MMNEYKLRTIDLYPGVRREDAMELDRQIERWSAMLDKAIEERDWVNATQARESLKELRADRLNCFELAYHDYMNERKG